MFAQPRLSRLLRRPQLHKSLGYSRSLSHPGARKSRHHMILRPLAHIGMRAAASNAFSPPQNCIDNLCNRETAAAETTFFITHESFEILVYGYSSLSRVHPRRRAPRRAPAAGLPTTRRAVGTAVGQPNERVEAARRRRSAPQSRQQARLGELGCCNKNRYKRRVA